MSKVSQDLHRRKRKKLLRKLYELLSRCDDAAFLQMAWAVNALQSKNGPDVREYLDYPEAAAVTEMDSPWRVHQWDIETLILLLLSKPKHAIRPGLNQLYNCRNFGTMGQAVNLLRGLENSEAVVSIDPSTILMEMHRIGQRQFGWQRGFATSERLYRFAFIYGQGSCERYFLETYGLTIKDFLHIGFVLFAHLQSAPWKTTPNLSQLDIDQTLLDKALPLLSRPLEKMREQVEELIDKVSVKNPVRIAYLPSALRRFPVITSAHLGAMIAPLPELIVFRVTSGLYYDLCAGPQHLLAEANDRFEHYARKVVMAFYPRFAALASQKYGTKKLAAATPDVLLKDGKEIVAVFECKATKLTYEAQFAENPIDEAQGAYTQLIKGITQLWGFFSNARRGIYNRELVATNAHAILLTMESWMQVSGDLQEQAIALAKEVVEHESDITEADMRPIIFCSIQDLLDVMITSSETTFLATLASAELPKYRGWGLREVRRDTGVKEANKIFPLDIAELLPWWKAIR